MSDRDELRQATAKVLDREEVEGVLSSSFYSPSSETHPAPRQQPARSRTEKPTHYKVICISMYTDDLKRLDDMVDTAGTLCKAAEALKNHGAERVVAYCTHPVLSGNAIKNIQGSQLDELVVTDTIPLNGEASECSRIRQLTISQLLAESVRRVCNAESISAMFV